MQNAFDLHAWLNTTISRLKEALSSTGGGRRTDKLLNSISGELIRNSRGLDQILIKFKQYGRFVDMGVGRGMPAGGFRSLGETTFLKKRNRKGQLHALARKPNPWFSKTKTRELARLRELILLQQEKLALNEIELKLKKK